MEVTLESLENAVSQFYHSDSALQAQAHQWLTSVQSSPVAWSFVWELLQPNRSKEGQFFAATTLHMKIMKNWNQVHPEHYEFLKNKLLETIVQYSTGPELILNRLCIALSALLNQMTPRYWEDSISDLLSMFQPENLPNLPPQRVIWILLEVLSFIPEEFQTMTFISAQKLLLRNELEKNTDKVISLIERSLGSEEVRDAAVKAAAAWLQMGVPLPACMNIAGSLINVVRSKISDITESCEHELEALNQMITHADTHKYPSCVLEILPAILQLISDIKPTGNDEALTNAYKILIGIGETHTLVILNALKNPETSERAQGLISHLLECTASPGDYPKDETRSQHVFSFWYLLQDEMINMDKENMQFISSYLVPVYEKLCEVLLDKSKLPNDIDSLSASDQELFRIYRQDIADTIVYCYYVAREHLIYTLVRRQREAQTWQEAEAVLHITLALAETSTAQDDETVIALLVNTPSTFLNHKVVNALNQAIGAYAEWLGNALGQLIPGLVASLLVSETATSATMALKDISRERTTSLEPYAPSLLAACQEALNKGHLKHAECVRIMYSVGRLLSVIPYSHMMSLLEPMVANYASDIQQLLTQLRQPQSKIMLILRLRMLSTLCSSLYSMDQEREPPSYHVLTAILPIFANVWYEDVIIVEVCHFLDVCVIHALTGKTTDSALVPIISTGAACYSKQPNKQALDLVKQVCILFGSGKHKNSICQFLTSVTQDTIRMSQSLEPEVLQGYFQVLASVIKKNPILLTSSVDIQQVINFATDSLLASEQPTVKASGTFLSLLITASGEEPAFALPIRAVGHNIVSTSLICIANRTPRAALDIFSDIFLALNKRLPENFPDWLQGGLNQLPTPEPNEKNKFYKMVLREKANKRTLSETIKEFALVSRGLVNLDYNH